MARRQALLRSWSPVVPMTTTGLQDLERRSTGRSRAWFAAPRRPAGRAAANSGRVQRGERVEIAVRATSAPDTAFMYCLAGAEGLAAGGSERRLDRLDQ